MIALPKQFSQVLSTVASRHEMERRSVLRIEAPFPAIVRAKDVDGRLFEERVVLKNLSAAGLYVCLPHRLELGTVLFAAVRLTLDRSHPEHAPGVAVRGVVLRADPQDEGTWGYGLVFIQQRFLFAAQT